MDAFLSMYHYIQLIIIPAHGVKQLLGLCGSMPLSQIPEYLQEKTREKRELEEDIERLRIQEIEAKTELQKAMNDKTESLDELQRFRDTKNELGKIGIPVDNIPWLVNPIFTY
jgi:DNA-binding transcriptional MerR regulator